jgi:leucyl aminopeptidase
MAEITRIADGVTLARDLINTPANDMGPEELALAAQRLAQSFEAEFNCIIGEDLARQNFPLINAVGMASPRAPRLIDFSWGDPSHPKVTLVGKGVCFDTGGLDLKPSSSMLIMKKDMGGAANVLALARMVMDARLKLRLRVLIPAVENAVAGNAFRPLDVFTSRKGLTVEIGNTDAEGRLVLADALALADEEKPDLLIDLGTLTGAARVALGPDLPPFYTDDEALAEALAIARSRNTIRCGDCRCGGLTTAGSIRKSPISITHRRAASPARLPAHCFCSALSRQPKAGCMSIFTAGRQRPNQVGPKVANARPRAPFIGF